MNAMNQILNDVSLFRVFSTFNPIALRKAKIVCNFGLPECNRVKAIQKAYYKMFICKILEVLFKLCHIDNSKTGGQTEAFHKGLYLELYFLQIQLISFLVV